MFLQFPLVVAIICALIGWLGALSLHPHGEPLMYVALWTNDPEASGLCCSEG